MAGKSFFNSFGCNFLS